MDHNIQGTIFEVFPIVEEIGDSAIKMIVVNAWSRALKEGSFSNIEDIPFSVSTPEAKLISHIHCVLKMALYMATTLEENMNISINRDLLIASVLLHDLGKVFEYQKKDNKYVKSDIGEKFAHGFWGAFIALEEGASQDLVHLIATHSNDSPVHPMLLEGIILHYADFAYADTLRFQKGMETFISMKG